MPFFINIKYNFLNNAGIGGEHDKEGPEIEEVGDKEDIEWEEVVFGAEPGDMKDFVEEQDDGGEEEGGDDLLAVGADRYSFMGYMKKILPLQQLYSSYVSVPSTTSYRMFE